MKHTEEPPNITRIGVLKLITQAAMNNIAAHNAHFVTINDCGLVELHYNAHAAMEAAVESLQELVEALEAMEVEVMKNERE